MLETINAQLEDYSKENVIDIMEYFMVQEGYATNDDGEILKMLF